MKLFGVVATVVWLFAATVAVADGVTLIPTEDATISEKSLDLSLGTATTLDSGTTGPNEGLKMNRALLKFDLTGIIPSNAVVTSAALTLTVVQAPTTTNLVVQLAQSAPGLERRRGHLDQPFVATGAMEHSGWVATTGLFQFSQPIESHHRTRNLHLRLQPGHGRRR